MAFLSQLKNANLKKTEAPKQLASIEPLLCNNDDEYKKLMEETFLEEYYESIKPFTFASEFFPLTQEASEAIREAYTNWDSTGRTTSTSDIVDRSPVLLELAHKIDGLQVKMNISQFFIRLSSRSAKDAALYTTKFSQVFNETLQSLSNLPNSTEENNRLISLYEGSTRGLACLNGKEAVQLLVSSSRIQEDLRNYSLEDAKEFNVIIREWATFEVQHEFRVFVYNRKVTAITQYNEYCYFPLLAEQKSAVQDIILQFVDNELLQRVSLNNLVIDVILVKDGHGNLMVKVIEINPFAEFAGTGLFSWEKDKGTLLGRGALEFRIQETVPKLAANNIASAWLPFLYPKTIN